MVAQRAGLGGEKQKRRQYFNSNEDMILPLAGQFKQLSCEPEKFR